MTQDLSIFNYEGMQLRTDNMNGVDWFVAKDICDILEINNSRDAIARLDDDEKGVVLTDTLGGKQNVAAVNESGLYSLILTSRKPEARKFKKWITSKVLPAIRKTGTYSMRPEIQIANALVLANQMIEDSKKLIAEMKPKADFFDTVTDSKDAVDIGTVAKVLNCGIGRTRLFEILRNESILMNNNQPYQKYIDCGYFRVIESSYNKPDGSTHISFKTVVYQKGIDFIRRKLSKELGK